MAGAGTVGAEAGAGAWAGRSGGGGGGGGGAELGWERGRGGSLSAGRVKSGQRFQQ